MTPSAKISFAVGQDLTVVESQETKSDGPLDFARLPEPLRPKLANASMVAFLALIAYAIVRSLAAALSKPLWNDELCTLIMARLPGVSALWSALEHAGDGNPPGFYIIERFFSRLLGNELISFRIGPLIGFCCIFVCVFAFIKRRSGDVYALLCTATLLVTAVNGFGAEARPYSLVLACVSIAMVCYQQAPSLLWMLLMALSLAAAQSMHYYAIFSFVPFGVAEAALFLRTRAFRVSVWLALLAGLIPLVVFWPLLSAFRVYMGPHFWSHPSLLGVSQIYGEFLHVPSSLGITVFAVASVAALAAMRSAESGEPESALLQNVPFQEYVLVLGLLGLPFAILVITRLAHGGMTERYALAAVLGIPVALSYVLSLLGRRGVALVVGFVVAALIFQEISFWQSTIPEIRRFPSPVRPVERLVVSVGYSDLPVVISAGINYLSVDHYASPGWRERFAIIADRDKEIANTGSDSLDAQFLVLRNYAPLRVYDLAPFESKYPRFLLYSHSTAPRGDWWPPELTREGYSVRLLGADGDGRVYLVDRNDGSTAK